MSALVDELLAHVTEPNGQPLYPGGNARTRKLIIEAAAELTTLQSSLEAVTKERDDLADRLKFCEECLEARRGPEIIVAKDLLARAEELEQALGATVAAWEALKGGNYRPGVVEDWLRKVMKPAIAHARSTLSRTKKEPSDG